MSQTDALVKLGAVSLNEHQFERTSFSFLFYPVSV